MRKSIYLFLFILCACVANAQDDSKMRQLYAQAESDYQIGRIDQARDALLQNLSSFSGISFIHYDVTYGSIVSGGF